MLPLLHRLSALAVAAVTSIVGVPGAVAAAVDERVPVVELRVPGPDLRAAVVEYCVTFPVVATDEGELGGGHCRRPSPGAVPRVSGEGRVLLAVDRPSWTWQATYRSTGSVDPACRTTRAATVVADGRYRLRPPRYAGSYQVTLVGTGPQESLRARFDWSYGRGRCS
ncbi:hypothetical protein KVF89_10270 [Nocardioides carbamazepini]|uniref:hypothetical protein n=1 Tax=Nocardioides carbamazepini TaxID=2854259 RepID=UPI00214A2E5C|nr:hypothetical protein [Nocardioides carbamazepini]MCR1782918.1 hypothetical protein [Nocardioides carbamazepini]